MLHAGFAGEVKAVRRFLREAEAIGKLRHPGIVAIHDRGQTDDCVPFIAMDLVEGPALGRQIADALQHAHERGVVHRDVKPGNVLLEDGRSRLADFGLADVMWGSELTATGEVIGTPAYRETRERLDERLRDGLHADLVSRMPGSPRVQEHVLMITIARGFEPHVAYDIGIRCVKSRHPVPFD